VPYDTELIGAEFMPGFKAENAVLTSALEGAPAPGEEHPRTIRATPITKTSLTIQDFKFFTTILLFFFWIFWMDRTV
jgi:hypothetical protein